ncbi:MAG TPA: FadR/GntR family transcriptional regulator [Spirochaetota bacterium]|nr:FadR/GntR family transcriptional regulator [Spirochaetota bacterium]
MTAQPAHLDPVSKNRLHDEIVRQFQRKIVRGEFAVGQKLPPERELAASLAVNRATLREALKKLEVLGLLQILHGDGIYVKDFRASGNLELFKALVYLDSVINADILRNMLDIRKLITPEMAARAAHNRSEADLARLAHIVEGEDPADILERDLAVHNGIALSGGNLCYLFIHNFFSGIIRDFGHLYFADPANVERSRRFHRDILEAIQKKDAKRAHRVMHDVLDYSEKSIYAQYDARYNTHS